MKLSTIIFDLDGTLLDTAPDLAFALNQVRINHGKEPLPYSLIRPLASAGSPGLLKLGFNISTKDADYPKLREEFLAIYEQNISMHTIVFNGMLEVLTQIKLQGLTWAVVTNKNTLLAQKVLKDLQLSDHCAALVGGDLVTNLKPAPDSLLLACQTLNVKPENCIYIGDAERDIVAAKAINMVNIAALYGYIGENEKPEEWQADYYIHNPIEIMTILKEICQQFKTAQY